MQRRPASRLAYPEVRAALAAADRHHDLSQDQLDAAEQAWEQYWAAVRPVELTAAVERHAGQLARSHALLGADAVHLASALAIGDPDIIIAVWDRRLHAGAATTGLHIPRAAAHPMSRPTCRRDSGPRTSEHHVLASSRSRTRPGRPQPLTPRACAPPAHRGTGNARSCR